MLLSERVYCMTIAFKMTEWVEQQICINLCVKLGYSPAETIQKIQKAAAMGNWWLLASSQKCACSSIMSCAEFFGETSNHRGDSAPYSPDLVPCNFWLFPKLKSPLKGKRFQTVEIQENMMVIGRTVWGSKMPTLKGTEVSLSYVAFLVSCVFFNKCLYFSYWLDTFWTLVSI